MSHFYLSGQGSRGETIRCGTKNSGISGHIRGWRAGVRVEGNSRGDNDEFLVYKTGGSNGYGESEYIGKVVEDNSGKSIFIPAREKNKE